MVANLTFLVGLGLLQQIERQRMVGIAEPGHADGAAFELLELVICRAVFGAVTSANSGSRPVTAKRLMLAPLAKAVMATSSEVAA